MHKNTQQFVEHIKSVWLEPEEVMASYDIKVLFIQVPVDPAIPIVKHTLQQDPLRPYRTYMLITQIITLVKFCPKNIYFLFQGKYFA